MPPKYAKLKNEDDIEFELNIPKTSLPSNSASRLNSQHNNVNNVSSSSLGASTSTSTLKNRSKGDAERSPRSSSTANNVLNNFKVASTIKYLEYKIDHTNDSLRSISLKFKVDVTEIKRHNQLQNDSDFYAKKLLNIPLNKYSSLFDLPDGTESPDGVIVRRTPSVSSISSHNGEGSTPPLLRQVRLNEKQTEAIKQKMEEIQEQTLNKNGLKNGVFTASATSKLEPPSLDDIDSSNARNFINSADSNTSDNALCSNVRCMIFLLVSALIILPLIYFIVWQEEKNGDTMAASVKDSVNNRDRRGLFGIEVNPKIFDVTKLGLGS